MSRSTLRISLWMALLAGCGPVRVGGQIDGDGVGGARDAIWDTLSLSLGPFSFEVTAVVLTDFDDACGTYADFLRAARTEFGCDDVCDEYRDLAEARRLHPERHWSTVLLVNTTDGQTDGFDLDDDLEAGEFDAWFNTYDTRPLYDAGACEDTCEDGDLLAPDTESGDEGELEMEVDGDLLRGRFTVSFDGDDRLDGRFVAEPCDMSEWVWDW